MCSSAQHLLSDGRMNVAKKMHVLGCVPEYVEGGRHREIVGRVSWLPTASCQCLDHTARNGETDKCVCGIVCCEYVGATEIAKLWPEFRGRRLSLLASAGENHAAEHGSRNKAFQFTSYEYERKDTHPKNNHPNHAMK